MKAGLAIPRVQKVISKYSNIVTHFRRSSKAMYTFKQQQVALGLPEYSLIQDVETRWNSTYRMMERICEQQALVCAALVDLKRVDLMLQGDDIKIMENNSKAIFQITESVSGESYGTLSSIKPLLHHLLKDALNPTSDDPSI